jgi:hypothetical protein
VPLPAPSAGTHLWVGVRFTSATAGLVLRDVPSAGASHDLYLENGAFYWFGGNPKANFALRLVGRPGSVGVDDGPAPALALAQPRPNPFRDGVELDFTLARAGEVRLEVHDLQGRRVRRLAAGRREAGAHRSRWNGADDQGRALPAGVYFVTLESGAVSVTRRVVLTP